MMSTDSLSDTHGYCCLIESFSQRSFLVKSLTSSFTSRWGTLSALLSLQPTWCLLLETFAIWTFVTPISCPISSYILWVTVLQLHLLLTIWVSLGIISGFKYHICDMCSIYLHIIFHMDTVKHSALSLLQCCQITGNQTINNEHKFRFCIYDMDCIPGSLT